MRAHEPALHVEHEAIPVGRSCGVAACASPLPAAVLGTPVVFGPDNAYLIEQFCLRVWPGADVGPLFCGGLDRLLGQSLCAAHALWDYYPAKRCGHHVTIWRRQADLRGTSHGVLRVGSFEGD